MYMQHGTKVYFINNLSTYTDYGQVIKTLTTSLTSQKYNVCKTFTIIYTYNHLLTQKSMTAKSRDVMFRNK